MLGELPSLLTNNNPLKLYEYEKVTNLKSSENRALGNLVSSGLGSNHLRLQSMVCQWLWHQQSHRSHCVLWFCLCWFVRRWSSAIQRENQRDRGNLESHTTTISTRRATKEKARGALTIHEQLANYSRTICKLLANNLQTISKQPWMITA